ncbi:hypothetical protein [Nostoc sp. CHAB 5715]|uniref:hypothetical protein n=1 Tax=Nostoc sp. CHAB 5715 TaxID=2780400 RepID=UPI001E3088DE|nr:hypothetical protein [Nostoc sp. CHAB 5715]MCC5624053.1 hypothetical protein [Nostoc sp. CHAB 5715]
MGRGGARPGAGRKKKYGEATKLERVPASWSPDDVAAAVRGREIVNQLTVLVESWQQQAAAAARESKTGHYPRTYDKALKLLSELGALLPSALDSNSLKDE